MNIKEILGKVPVYIWVIAVLICIVLFYWASDDIGSWWENRKQEQFIEADNKKQMEIDILVKQRDEALQRASAAEAREVIEQQQADQLRNLIKNQGGKVEQQQKIIDEAANKYKSDLELIEGVKTGKISSLELCQLQCAESAKLGYECRKNFCDKYK